MYSQATVASSKDVADRITGSLVDAANLSNNLGLMLSIVAAAAAFLLAALLALSSVGKRVRELGTLKALGWTQRRVVRQVAGESLTQGVLGGILGVPLGVAVAFGIGLFGPTQSASSTTGGGNLFGIQQVACTTSAGRLPRPRRWDRDLSAASRSPSSAACWPVWRPQLAPHAFARPTLSRMVE